MSDRTVSVRLRAVTSEYTAAMAKAGQSTKAFAKDAVQHVEGTARSLQGVSTEATIAGGALLGLGVAAVASTARFDKQMSAVQAATKASAATMEQLRASALKAGADTVFSATEAAAGQEALSKAGVSTADILRGGLRGALDLAAAGGIEVADAADTAATALTVFGLRGSDVEHVADLLAAGAGKAQGGVDDLGMALKQSALVAKQTGLSVEDTTGALAEFASAGLIGSDAGTSFKTMLQRLTPQSAQAADLMDQLGLNAYDASGQFIGLEAYAGKLRAGLSKLTPEARNAALATLFGSDAVRAAAVLYNDGAEGVKKWRDNVNDAGYATEQAATRLDNLAGDVEQLRGSLETTFIKTGSDANGVMRGSVKIATDLVNEIGDLPGPVLAAGLAVTTLSGGFLLLAPRIVGTMDAITVLGERSPRTTRVLGGLTKAVGAYASAAAIATIATQPMRDEIDKLQPGVEQLESVMRSYAEGGARWFTSATFDGANALNQFNEVLATPGMDRHLDNITNFFTFGAVDNPRLAAAGDFINNFDQALSNLVSSGHADIARKQLDGLSDSLKRQAIAQGTVAPSMDAILGQLPQYKDALAGVGNAAKDAAGANSDLSGAVTLADLAASKAEDAVKNLDDALKALRGQTADADTATANLEQSFADATEAVKKNGQAVTAQRTKLDLTTQAGRDNQAALKGISDALFDAVPAWQAAGASTTEIEKRTKDARDEFVAAAIKMGLTKAAAKELADKYGLIPTKVATAVTTSGFNAAQNAADELKRHLDNLQGTYVVEVRGSALRATRRDSDTSSPGHATGGFVYGPGPSWQDSFDTRAADGEFITRAAVAQANKPLMTAVNANNLPAAYAYLAARVGASPAGGITIGQITAISAPGEQAATSVPRALRNEAFLLGMGGR